MVLPIIIVNYNNPADTIECIQSLLCLNNKDVVIILVDNSDDCGPVQTIKNWLNNPVKVETLSQIDTKHFDPNTKIAFSYFEDKDIGDILLKDYTGEVVIIKTTNRGFAAANNIALAALIKEDFPWIWLLNSDTVAPGNAVSLFKEKVTELDTAVGLVANKLCYYHNPEILQGLYGVYYPKYASSIHAYAWQKDKDVQEPIKLLKEFEYPIGASLFVKKEFVKDVGLMNEKFFLYFEEIDWVVRGNSKGWKAAFVSDVKVYHKEGASVKSGQKIKSLLADMYSIRNKLLMTETYFKKYLPLVKISIILTIGNRFKRRQFERARVMLKYFLTKKFDGPFKFND